METVKGKKRSKKFGAAQRGEMEMTGQSGTWERRGGKGIRRRRFKIERRTRSVRSNRYRIQLKEKQWGVTTRQ